MNLFDLFATITVDTDAYESGLEEASQKTQEFGNTTETQTSKFSSAWSSVSVAVGNLISDAVSGLVNTISSNIDSAIARVDTLNSYTTVMTGLGYSAEEADAAITALTEGIQGLPTTLPNIVSQQQQFAALSGNIEEATELTIALNNATLAGGQGQEAANSALNQWYQIIANGTPDLQSWRIINQAMPAQLQQIAQALMGTEATAQDLFDAWQEGTIATEEVTAAIVKLNEEGLEGFDNFATQAQSASTGIETSMTNVKTAIVNQLATIIDEMNGDSGRITAIFDTIKASIKGIDTTAISESLGNLMVKITEVLSTVDLSAVFTGIADAASLAVDAIGFLIDNFDTLLPIITGVTAAMVTFKVATSISSVVDTLTTALKNGKTAFQALTAAMNANPFVLIATLIAGVVTALVTLWNTNEDFRNAVISIWEKIKEVFSNAWEGIKSVFSGWGEFFSGLWDKLTDAFSNVWEWFTDIGSNIVNGIKNGISNAWNSFTSWVSDKFNSLVSGVKSLLGIASPSKVFAEIGGYMAEGLGEGWEDEYSGIKKQIENGLDFGTANIDFASSGLGVASAGMVNGISSAVQSAGGAASYTFNLLFPDGTKFASYAFQPMVDYAKANGTPILNPT